MERETLFAGLDLVRRLAKDFGPYLLIEILLPGGTLFALLLYVHRNGGFSHVARLVRAFFGGAMSQTSKTGAARELIVAGKAALANVGKCATAKNTLCAS